MKLIEIKDSKDETFSALLNPEYISNISMRAGAYDAGTITIELAGNKTAYSKSYETMQDAQNVFGELKDVLLKGEGTVTL